MWVHLYTAWTPTSATQTTLASQWGLLINIDSATGDIAQTWSGWIEDEKYGFYAREFATSTSAEFDSTVTRTGRLTLKLSTLDATWVCRVLNIAAPNFSTAATNLAASWKLIPIKANTKYRYSCYVKTNNAAASSVLIQFQQLTSTWATTSSSSSSLISWTVDWTNLTWEFTTSGTAVWLWLIFYISTAWNVSDAWFDVNSMTLEEVVEPVANSLTSSSPSLVSFTAVGSTDNIDQSFTTGTASWASVWNIAWTSYLSSQSFTATKSKHTWVILYKKTNTWTPTWNLKVDLRTDNAGAPSATILATYTIPLATYNALSVWEFTVNLPSNITAWSKYHYVLTDTATEASGNAFTIWGHAAGGYTWWDCRYSTDGGTSWVVNGTLDLYFKTLYYKPTTNFKASQNNLSVSVSADEDGFLNGSVINLQTWTATFTETFGTFYLLQYTISGSDLIAEINLPWVGLSSSFTSDRTLEYSSDWVTYGSTFPTGVTKVWVKILAYSWFASFSYSIQFSTSGLSILKNYPTNKDIIKQYSTILSGATTTATYRATKWWFPAIEYSSTEYQYLDIDTTATGSTVAFSELWTSYTTVADWASLAITSTSTPSIFVKANITANRLYLSSNDYNSSSDKDGSMRQSVVYEIKPNPQITPWNMNSNIKLFYW